MVDIFAAFIIDAAAGDPQWFPHPVRIIGKYIKLFEKAARKATNSQMGLKITGVFLTITTVVISFTIPFFVLTMIKVQNVWIYYAVNIILLYTCLAARCLADEGTKIQNVLKNGSIEEARIKLSHIVGRDTERLDEEAIIRATVETISENTSDGVIAPLFYMTIGGAPLALAYKAINTLDSMVGYKNEEYKSFGWASAKLDDIVNFIPARITALLMVIAAFLLGYDWKGSLSIFLRDRKKHNSPNSGCPESAVAGALGVQLGGTSTYFGKPYVKPTIGDKIRYLDRNDIIKTSRIMYTASCIYVLILVLASLKWGNLA